MLNYHNTTSYRVSTDATYSPSEFEEEPPFTMDEFTRGVASSDDAWDAAPAPTIGRPSPRNAAADPTLGTSPPGLTALPSRGHYHTTEPVLPTPKEPSRAVRLRRSLSRSRGTPPTNDAPPLSDNSCCWACRSTGNPVCRRCEGRAILHCSSCMGAAESLQGIKS